VTPRPLLPKKKNSPVSGSDTAPCDRDWIGAGAGLADGEGPNGDAPTLGREKRLLGRFGWGRIEDLVVSLSFSVASSSSSAPPPNQDRPPPSSETHLKGAWVERATRRALRQGARAAIDEQGAARSMVLSRGFSSATRIVGGELSLAATGA
jgi:hypothetical protein